MTKNLLAASLTLAFGASMVGNAQADAVAQSKTNITDFQFLVVQGTLAAPAPVTQLLDASMFASSSLNIVDQTNLNPLLNGVGASTSYTTFTVGGAPLEASPGVPQIQCAVGGACPNPMTLAALGNPSAAEAASMLNGAPISGLPSALPNLLGANAFSSALAQITGTGVANTTSSITLNSGFTFALAQSRQVTIDFNGALDLLASLNSQVSALTGSTWTLSITDLGASSSPVFSWSPDGQVSQTSGIFGGTEQADGCNLQANRNAFGPGGTSVYNCSGYFEATTNTLLAGHNYSIGINQQNNANVLVVPEPSSLLLAGLALAGLGFGASRRKQK